MLLLFLSLYKLLGLFLFKFIVAVFVSFYPFCSLSLFILLWVDVFCPFLSTSLFLVSLIHQLKLSLPPPLPIFLLSSSHVQTDFLPLCLNFSFVLSRSFHLSLVSLYFSVLTHPKGQNPTKYFFAKCDGPSLNIPHCLTDITRISIEDKLSAAQRWFLQLLLCEFLMPKRIPGP